MTSLHVICGLAPSMKNPGYAYDLLHWFTTCGTQEGFSGGTRVTSIFLYKAVDSQLSCIVFIRFCF